MIRKRIGRLSMVLTSAALAAMLVGPGFAAAQTPTGWGVDVVKLPATVKAGNNAGYSGTIRNFGPSNVNNVTFTIVPTDTPNATPSYFPGLSGYTCTTTGQVSCYLGTMAAGTSITFTVAYAVPGTSSGTFDVAFRLRAGTGDVIGKNHSRGDAYENPVKTGLNNNQNFDGGFTVGASTFVTTGSLGRNNQVTTTLDLTDLSIPVNVTDEVDDFACNLCSNLVGRWSVLEVDGGSAHAIKVTIMVWGGSVPGGVTLKLIHADGTGASTTLTLADNTCNATHSNADCLVSITKVGNNYKFVAWFKSNGGARGGY